MTWVDWTVLALTTLGIVVYGVVVSRRQSTQAFLGGSAELKWPTVGLAVMATQASAITFLSTPGQAYEDGLRFVQFYFGLPLAMIFLCATMVPLYHRLRVRTAYEYLEIRFDQKTRQLTAFLFLLSRGLAAGITLYAPAIVLSALLGWSLEATVIGMGVLTTVYTVTGGTSVVSRTQKHQMTVMLVGIGIAFFVVLSELPEGVGAHEAFLLGGALGKMNALDFSFDPTSRYTIWSGLTGGFFLSLAYFGTDQSQVQRYLANSTVTESRLGLLFNGLLKIPMQFVILLTGVMVFSFYLFTAPPAFFNSATRDAAMATAQGPAIAALEETHAAAFSARRAASLALLEAERQGATRDATAAREALSASHAALQQARADVKATIATALPGAETKDSDYIFLHFVMTHMPTGLLGILLAVILSAAMSSTAGELNALSSTTAVDFWQRSLRPSASDAERLVATRWFTVVWGGLAMAFASFAAMLDNLIQAVNILGSLFYGTVLGIFMVGLFLRRVSANAVFAAALVSQALVVALFLLTDLGFLWFNVVGCVTVMVLSLGLSAVWRQSAVPAP
jgi:SSS family transporter